MRASLGYEPDGFRFAHGIWRENHSRHHQSYGVDIIPAVDLWITSTKLGQYTDYQ